MRQLALLPALLLGLATPAYAQDEMAPVARMADDTRMAVPMVMLEAEAAEALRGSDLFAAATGQQEFTCVGGILCICVGDDDCNDMFSTICSDTSTGGSCTETDGETVCACTPTGR